MFNSNGIECEEHYNKNNELIGCTAEDGMGDEQGFVSCKKCEVKDGCIAKKARIKKDPPDNCIFDDESCKSIDYRSASGERADDYANIPCEYYEICKNKKVRD